MSDWLSPLAALLWQNAITVIPLALVVAIVCRCCRNTPATRHTLWLLVLAWFVAPAVLPRVPHASVSTDAAGEPAVVAIDSCSSALPVVSARPEPRATETLAPSAGSAGQPEPLPAAAAAPARSSHMSAPSKKAVSETPARPARKKPQPLPVVPRPDPKPAPIIVALASPSADAVCAPAVAVDLPETHAPVVESRPAAIATRIETSVVATWTEFAQAQWIAALAWFATIGATFEHLPTIPTGLWLAGFAGLAAGVIAQVVCFRRRFARAIAAPADVLRLVDDVARQYGLRRKPQTLMVDDRVSPMVWGGWWPQLILPRPLWEQLDEAGRRAVLCHELAHLRRRDHWVRWLDLLVCALFWWHPLAWWVRRRVHEEAELCCDAWVTHLMPHGRRAYAQALLKTKQYLSDGAADAAPAVGIGVTSSRTKRMARRLTMVMTESVRPRLGLAGIALALVLATTGWLTLPARACPPDEKVKVKVKATKEHAHATGQGECTGAEATAPTPPIPPVPPVPPIPPRPAVVPPRMGAQTLWSDEPVVGGAENTFAQHADARRRLALTLASAQSSGGLEERMARLEAELARLSAELDRLSAHGAPGTPAPTPFAAIRRTAPALAPTPTPRASASGEVVIRSYRLPEGKRKALYELLARDDVPILVSVGDDVIQVHATEEQHRTFRAFLQMINPEGGAGAFAPTPHAAVAAAPRIAAQLERAAAMAARRGDAQKQARELAAVARAKQRDASRFESQADRFREKAESMQDKIRALAEKAAESGEAQKRELFERQARELEAQARELEAQAREFEQQMRETERQADDLQSQSESLEAESEAIAADAEALAEAVAEVSDESDADTDDVEDMDTDVDGAMAPPAERSVDVAPLVGRIVTGVSEAFSKLTTSTSTTAVEPVTATSLTTLAPRVEIAAPQSDQ